MNSPCVTFVVFGGTGDLAKRKLVPAVADLVKGGKISKDSLFIGIARGDFTSETYKRLLVASAGTMEEKAYIQELNIQFYQGDASEVESLRGLSAFIHTLEHDKETNRVFYLATSFKLFGGITSELAKQGLHTENSHFSRIVFEKPFGENLKSSDDLDRTIKQYFNEQQVYRIDHYVAKETVQNILVLKSTNPWFDSLLDSSLIERIEVIVDEELGVGTRLEYYDGVGALKDMLQNHLLQVLALLLMEPPESFTTDAIHNRKREILAHIRVKPFSEHLLGQYESYQKEAELKGIVSTRTETFARIALQCEHPRWKGTKIMLRTGKKLPTKYGQIRVHFKQTSPKLLTSFESVTPAMLLINIYPTQDISMIFNTLKPGTHHHVEQAHFKFVPSSGFGPNTIDEYATLINDVLVGEKILFTRYSELRESWKIVEQIEALKSKIPFVTYKDGSDPEHLA